MSTTRTFLVAFSSLALTVSSAWSAAAPTRFPYIQSLGKDRVTVLWRTATPVIQSVDCGLNGAFNITATDAIATTQHELTLTGLAPGKNYGYRIREGATVVLTDATQYWFKTDAGVSDEQFSFFVTGDIGAELPDGKQVLTQAMIRNVAPRADFGLLCGDTVYPDGEEASYDPQLMSLWRPLLCNTPAWPCLGNHDWHVDPDVNFKVQWALPNNEHYYSFDYGNAHFVALDTADGFLYDEVNQLAWLRADLRSAHGRHLWTFVYYHHPLLTCTYKSNIPDLAAKIFPILAEFKVDVVFNGHAHTYERLYPLNNGVPVNQAQNPNYVDPQGTMFIVSGCGGKFNSATSELTTFCGPTAAFQDGKILFTQAFVNGQTLYIMTFDSNNGAIVDYVSIRKTQPITDVAVAPMARTLHQNVPNPFNPTTVIPFDLDRTGRVQMSVFRLDGSLVRDLVDAIYSVGPHEAMWDGRDRFGKPLPSGAYLCRMETEGKAWSIKMLMVR